MQRNHTFLDCVYGLFVVTMGCITYVAFYKTLKPSSLPSIGEDGVSAFSSL